MKKDKFVLLFASILLSVCILLSGCKSTSASIDESDSSVAAPSVSENFKNAVQIIINDTSTLGASEKYWVSELVNSSLESNLHDYLGLVIFFDEETETSSAKYGLLTNIRKTSGGYSIAVDYTNLKTGKLTASAESKSYTKPENLYESTGAADEVTLQLANALKIHLSDLSVKQLSVNSSKLSVKEQEAIAKQNEVQFKKKIIECDDEIEEYKESTNSNSLLYIQRLETEKALLAVKQKAETNRLEELKRQKEKAAEDSKLEKKRSKELKNQRDEIAKEAETIAEELRTQTIENQGVLSQINIIEAKKKSVMGIRDNLESEYFKLFTKLLKNCATEENKIRTNDSLAVGFDANLERKVFESNKALYKEFLKECAAVEASVQPDEDLLLTEIAVDEQALTKEKTVSSLGDELKVSFGPYESKSNGWDAYISLYSNGILLYSDNIIVNIEEYTNNTDMYNSFLVQGYPVVYFEMDYNITAASDSAPSKYDINIDEIRVINTSSGKVCQTTTLNKTISHQMIPALDIENIGNRVPRDLPYYDCLIAKKIENQEKRLVEKIEFKESENEMFVELPAAKIQAMNTLVSKDLYTSIMGSDPSKSEGDDLPVDSISKYDAIYFCNKLSLQEGLQPVYSVKGTTDPDKWNYVPHSEMKLSVKKNSKANGYRLPTLREWKKLSKNLNQNESLSEWCWTSSLSGRQDFGGLWPTLEFLTTFFGVGCSLVAIPLFPRIEVILSGTPLIALGFGGDVIIFFYLGRRSCCEGGQDSLDILNFKGDERVGFRVVRNLEL